MMLAGPVDVLHKFTLSFRFYSSGAATEVVASCDSVVPIAPAAPTAQFSFSENSSPNPSPDWSNTTDHWSAAGGDCAAAFANNNPGTPFHSCRSIVRTTISVAR